MPASAPPLPEPPPPPAPPLPTAATPLPSAADGQPPVPAAEALPPSPGKEFPTAASETPPPVVKPRRRGRTTLLIASAAVLGVLAGGGLGYRIQQQRTPTPLPPLTGPVLAQPKGAGAAPKTLPASQDSDVIFDGNLLKLLVPTPKGAKEEDRDWESLADYAERFTKPAGAFVEFAGDDFRRAADASWMVGHHTVVTVELAQFRDDASPYAPERISDQSMFNDDDPQLGDSHDVPNTLDGKAWGSDKPERRAGYEPVYYGHGLARVGNIVIEVFVASDRPVQAGTVSSLVTKQLERL